MRQTCLLLLFFILFVGSSQAQFIYKVDKKHINVSIGYYSILDLPSEDQKFRHGASLSASYSIVNKYREKIQRKTQINRILDRDIYAKLNFTTYKREAIHNIFAVSAGPAFRVTIPEGMFYEFDGMLGYMRTFLPGDHFVFEEEAISATKRLGSNLISLQGNAIVGWNFSKSNNYPAALYAGVGLMSYFPNNKKWLFQPQFQAGLSFVLIRLKESYREDE